MSACKLPGDGKTQATAAAGVLARWVAAVKGAEDSLALVGSNAGAAVAHADAEDTTQATADEIQLAAAVQLCIGNEVCHRPLQRQWRQGCSTGVRVQSQSHTARELCLGAVGDVL